MAAGGGILPMRNDADVLAELVKENEVSLKMSRRSLRISANKCSMDLPILPRELGKRIRDISLRVRPEMPCWSEVESATCCLATGCMGREKHPASFRIIEEGGKFGVILDRLIRRYNEFMGHGYRPPWVGWLPRHPRGAASASIESASINKAPLPSPTGIVIDVPETERPSSLGAALDLVERDGVILILEPEVPG